MREHQDLWQALQDYGRAAKDYREPMGPQPTFNKGGQGGIRNLRIHI